MPVLEIVALVRFFLSSLLYTDMKAWREAIMIEGQKIVAF